MSDLAGRLIADFACLDPIYVDGIVSEGVVSLGTNFATQYFRWVPAVHEGRVIMERVPAIYLIRPIASLAPHDPLALLLQGQPDPMHAAFSKH